MKFGGSSVADASCMRQVAALVTAALPQAPLVVLSAMGKTTDGLFAAARAAERGDGSAALASAARIFAHAGATTRDLLGDAESCELLHSTIQAQRKELEVLLSGVALLEELTPRTLDAIVSHGERLSTAILAALLRHRDIDAEWFDCRTVLRTDEQFGKARPQRDAIRTLSQTHLLPKLRPGRAVVTQGYLGSTSTGLTTTLGRGGSDWTASLLGAALDADEVQIWTDVEGVLTADPRVVPQAQPVPVMSFAEAAELAAFGAKVLHPATIQPAVDVGIPVTVRHTLRPEGRFTTITTAPAPEARRDHAHPITALASRGPLTVLTLTSTRMLHQSGYLARVFAAFGNHGVSVDLIATAEVAVSCTVDPDAPLGPLLQELQQIATVTVQQDRAIVAVIGEGLRGTKHVVERVFGALDDLVPELISMGGNEINLSFVLPQLQAPVALQRLHRRFFEESR